MSSNLKQPFIAAGERLTRETGEHYATARHDIEASSTVKVSDYDFVGDPPASGTTLDRTVFKTHGQTVIAVNIEGQWRYVAAHTKDA